MVSELEQVYHTKVDFARILTPLPRHSNSLPPKWSQVTSWRFLAPELASLDILEQNRLTVGKTTCILTAQLNTKSADQEEYMIKLRSRESGLV